MRNAAIIRIDSGMARCSRHASNIEMRSFGAAQWDEREQKWDRMLDQGWEISTVMECKRIIHDTFANWIIRICLRQWRKRCVRKKGNAIANSTWKFVCIPIRSVGIPCCFFDDDVLVEYQDVVVFCKLTTSDCENNNERHSYPCQHNYNPLPRSSHVLRVCVQQQLFDHIDNGRTDNTEVRELMLTQTQNPKLTPANWHCFCTQPMTEHIAS